MTMYFTGEGQEDITKQPECLLFPTEHEIIKVQASSRTYLAIDATGTVFIWGDLLGTNPPQYSFTPLRIQTVSEPIVDLALGNHHGLLLTLDGAALSFGHYPGTGMGSEVPLRIGKHSASLSLLYFTAQLIFASLYSASKDPSVPTVAPFRINDSLDGKTITKIAAFKDNSLFLTADGSLYECGDVGK